MRKLLAFLIAALLPGPADAVTRVVPDSFPTIAGALATSAPGDTVLVRSGTYPENLTLVDGVLIRGEDPGDRPVVDGSLAAAVFVGVACGPGTRIEDVIIRNGFKNTLGGGVYLVQSSVGFLRCRFEQNSANRGGGIGADDASFTLTDCEFFGNTAAVSGGAVAVTDGSAPTLEACVFRGNSSFAGGAIAVLNGATPLIQGCMIDSCTADQGAAVWYDFLTAGTLTGNTITRCDATGLGGILYFGALATPVVNNNIVALGQGGGATIGITGAVVDFGCNCLFGNVGGNTLHGGIDDGTNLFVDPLFCDAPSGDYSIFQHSPCNSVNECGLIGALAPDCASVGVEPGVATSTWAGIKSHWR
jgi:predicted outer membrane repeat protein